MSDANTAPTGTPAPAAPPATAAPAAPAPAPAANATEGQEPAWLPARLEQARRAAENGILAGLGVKDAAELKAALDAHRAQVEASKTEAERVAAKLAAADAAIARAAALEGALKVQADAALAGLTPEQRAAVERLSGGDAARVVESVALLRPTWAASAAPAAAPPANTSPAAPAPAPAAPGSPPDHRAEYQRLKQTNAIQAANYAARHRDAIWPAPASP